MMSLSFVGVAFSYITIIEILKIFYGNIVFSNAIPFYSMNDLSQSSHSGPTNALYGHEKFVDEDIVNGSTKNLWRNKRAAFYNYNSINSNNNYNNDYSRNLLVSSEPPDPYMQMWIVSQHNLYRKMTKATNMRMIYWNDQLAASAQAHANKCDFRHSRNRINIGENIWAAPYANYSDAIYRWYNEVNDPYCGCTHSYKHCCGHYVQVVWAQTNLVGCGFARCNSVQGVPMGWHRAVFVCHYSPQGNRVYVANGQLRAVPAFTWAYNESERCRDCPADAPACYQGLCYMPKDYKAKMKKFYNDNALNSNSIVRA